MLLGLPELACSHAAVLSECFEKEEWMKSGIHNDNGDYENVV